MFPCFSNSTKYHIHPKAERFQFESIVIEFENSLKIFRDLGIIINHQSRLLNYLNVLRTYTESKHPYQSLFNLQRFSFALREIDEIIEIVKTIGNSPTAKEIEILKEIPKGNWHPDDDTNTQARDRQYELWLKTFLAKKGIVCKLSEPDLLFRWGDRQFPIAAKRPKSRMSLDGRLQTGIKQLDPFPQGGVIAISVDSLLRPRNTVLYASSQFEAAENMDYLFLGLLQWLISRNSPMTARGEGRNIISYLISGKIPVFIEEQGVFCMESRNEYLSITNDNRHLSLAGLRKMVSSYNEHLEIR